MAVILAAKREVEPMDIRDSFCQAFSELAGRDRRLVLLNADVMNATNTKSLLAAFPDRVYNCGIAEANMAGVAAGLGLNGFVPFIQTFGTFATRRIHDQVFISGAYAQSTVKIIGCDPGVTATFNGGTHMPFEDVALMRVIPGMTVIEITDTVMMRDLLPKIAAAPGMAYIRMARKGVFKVYEDGSAFDLGGSAKLRDGSDVAILASGFCVKEALDAAETLAEEGIRAAVYDIYSIKPLDAGAVFDAAKATGAIVTAENHSVIGGMGSAVAELLAQEYPIPVVRTGAMDRFGEVGALDYLAKTIGVVAGNIAENARKAIAGKKVRGGAV